MYSNRWRFLAKKYMKRNFSIQNLGGVNFLLKMNTLCNKTGLQLVQWRFLQAKFRSRHYTMDAYAGSVRFQWPRTISNSDLLAKTNSEPIKKAIKKRRLRWLGYVLSMSPNRITMIVFRWTPKAKESKAGLKFTSKP